MKKPKYRQGKGLKMQIALIGNQNSGKTTLFNALTGLNQKIGNWPGVTIEKKTGKIKETDIEITDLPGIYSLSPYSEEEKIATNYILEENPDLIINIIDATNIERSLYLTTQLLELDCKIIVVLNMIDILEKKGLKINVRKLEDELKVNICTISALKQKGIEQLIEKIKQQKTIKNQRTKSRIYDSNIENSIEEIGKNITKNKRFLAIKILEKDKRFKKLHKTSMAKIVQECEKNYQVELEEEIATQRYKYIEYIVKKSVYRYKKLINTTEILDKIFLNKLIAIPIFAIIMIGIYFLSVGVVGNYTVDIINEYIEKISEMFKTILINIHISEWLISLIIDGIIKGVGTVLSFVPQLIILFFCISILETTGYISRVALILDKIFRKVGLNGKSIIPFIVGSGCSVPGILSSRIIENEKERKLTSILVPFIPCSAKLPIIALFSGYFFKENTGLISASLYFMAIIIIIISSYIIKKFIIKEHKMTFIIELPEYKLPSLKYVKNDVTEKTIQFIKRAGSTIFLCSIIIWFMLSFSIDLKYGVEIEKSILATIGKKISFIFYPILGVNSWEATVSAIQGLIAKEQVVSSMSIISGISQNEIFKTGNVFEFFSPVSAYSFVVFNLFSAPCIGAISAMKKELGKTKNVLIAIAFQTTIAWLIATGINLIGNNIF